MIPIYRLSQLAQPGDCLCTIGIRMPAAGIVVVDVTLVEVHSPMMLSPMVTALATPGDPSVLIASVTEQAAVRWR